MAGGVNVGRSGHPSSLLVSFSGVRRLLEDWRSAGSHNPQALAPGEFGLKLFLDISSSSWAFFHILSLKEMKILL